MNILTNEIRFEVLAKLEGFECDRIGHDTFECETIFFGLAIIKSQVLFKRLTTNLKCTFNERLILYIF